MNNLKIKIIGGNEMKRQKMTKAKWVAHIMVLIVIVGIIVGVAAGGETFVTFIKEMHGM